MSNYTSFVLVDFENVPEANLSLVEKLPVHVTLLIGKLQTWLPVAMVQQIKRQHSQIELIEVGASGRNALDLTLAFYLGRYAEKYPGVDFFIVSKDQDFDAMITHLRAQGRKISRVENFAALPFLPAKKSAPPSKKKAGVKSSPSPKAGIESPNDERFDKMRERLKHASGPHPKTKEKLLHHIANAYGKKLSEPEVQRRLQMLTVQGIVKIDADGNATY